ncbi:adhesin, partial [Neisseria gonorrhoeae]
MEILNISEKQMEKLIIDYLSLTN